MRQLFHLQKYGIVKRQRRDEKEIYEAEGFGGAKREAIQVLV